METIPFSYAYVTPGLHDLSYAYVYARALYAYMYMYVVLVSYAAIFRLVTQRSSPGEERCVTSLKTAA